MSRGILLSLASKGAAAVGQAYTLDEHDFISGTHRGHGELIAKGLATLRKLSDEQLMHIM